MKYLDKLTKLREPDQNAEHCKRELTKNAESGKAQLHKTSNMQAFLRK